MLLVSPAALAQAAQPTPVVAFGDSVTIGFREPGVECANPNSTAKGYPEHLEDQLTSAGRDVAVTPRGKCGELTAEGVSRIDDVLSEGTFAGQTGVVLVMEGTNDLARGNPAIGNETVAANLQLIAGKVSAQGWTPVYSSIIPFGPPANGLSRNERAERLAASLSELAFGEGRPFADPFQELWQLPDLFADYYDSDGYHLNAEGNELLADAFFLPSLAALDHLCVVDQPCVEDGPTLCLQDGRFQIDVEWQTLDAEGVGFGEPQTTDTGKFWFFGPQNLELLVKVLDARCLSGHFWVFYGALTNQQFSMTVTDTTTCARRVYFSPNGTMASIGDTGAFPVPPDPETCPGQS